MRYFRSLVFDVGLMLALCGVLAAFWTAKDIIALTLQFSSRQWSSEGSGMRVLCDRLGLVVMPARRDMTMLVVRQE